jgi:molybdopterin synthase sulfur carrier subunit
VRQVPLLQKHWLNDAGELHAHVHCFVNGNDVGTLPEKWHSRLHTGDVLDFIPPVAGG